MATWEPRAGPCLLQERGRSEGGPSTPNQMCEAFDRERKEYPNLPGAVPHGVCAKAVIRLRNAGYTPMNISDMVGMSAERVKHRCRQADRRASGQAVLREIRARSNEQIAKKPGTGTLKCPDFNLL